MVNTNCLEGIACPQCKQEDTFEIQASTWATVTDDGTDSLTDTAWDDDSSIVCSRCHHTGTVAQFKVPSKPIWVVVWTWYATDGTRLRGDYVIAPSRDESWDLFAQKVSYYGPCGDDDAKVVVRLVEVPVPESASPAEFGHIIERDPDGLENRLPTMAEHTMTTEDISPGGVTVKFDWLRAVISSPEHIVVVAQDSDGPVHIYVDGHDYGTISMEKED